MTISSILLVGALVFGVCFLVDKSFAKAFRSKAQHRSGLAVRANKQYGVFGVALSILGFLGICVSAGSNWLLSGAGILVLGMGICLAGYYLTFGIFYDGESFLCSSFGKQDVTYHFKDIREQKLYLIQGGTVVVELHMADGTAVSVQSGMDGVYPFLDTAFAGWCLQNGREPQDCPFYDPANHWWFPHEEVV